MVGQSGCLACHVIGDNGNNGPGPALTHIGSSTRPGGADRLDAAQPDARRCRRSRALPPIRRSSTNLVDFLSTAPVATPGPMTASAPCAGRRHPGDSRSAPGDARGAAGAGDVRPDRGPVRPHEHGDDRRACTTTGAGARPTWRSCRPATGRSTWPPAPVTWRSSWPAASGPDGEVVGSRLLRADARAGARQGGGRPGVGGAASDSSRPTRWRCRTPTASSTPPPSASAPATSRDLERGPARDGAGGPARRPGRRARDHDAAAAAAVDLLRAVVRPRRARRSGGSSATPRPTATCRARSGASRARRSWPRGCGMRACARSATC